MRQRGFFALFALLVAALAIAAAGCGGGGDEGGGEATTAEATDTGAAAGGGETTTAETSGGGAAGAVTALPSSSCGEVEYGGDGEANVLIASDLPLQGASRTQTTQINDAIRLVLEQHSWKAGDLNVAFQACDDATAQAGKWDSGKCNQNAQAYAQNQSLLGVIGTFNSGCAAIIIPVLNQAPGGGIAMVSPANTFVCLTAPSPSCDASEPDKYYPTGNRNYTRTVANDAYQGAANAILAQKLGVTKVYVLNDKEAYGLGVATNFRGAAQALGIEVVGFEAWDPKASSYEALYQKIKGTGADGVFLGGLIDENGGQVIRDKVSVLGPNAKDASEGVVLLAPDGFTTQATVEPDEGGAKEAEGMYLSVAGVPLDQLGEAGQQFASDFEAKYSSSLAGNPVDPYAAYGGESAEVLLDAIEAGGTDRAAVISSLFATDIQDGILGSFKFDANGDPQSEEGATVAITEYRATADTALAEVADVISPPAETVEAALSGGQ